MERAIPDRLRGDEIPLMARIVAVADAFHAMASRHNYREALSLSRAVDALVAGRGTQWDPTVIDAVLGIVGREPRVTELHPVPKNPSGS